MKIDEKRIVLIAAGGLFLFFGLINMWPLPIEPSLSNSLKLYGNYFLGRPTPVSSLLGPVDIACAIGPYDSFTSTRFTQVLNARQRASAEEALAQVNKTTSGSNNLLLVGLRGDTVSTLYLSQFFFLQDKRDDASTEGSDCVSGAGMMWAKKVRKIIVITLKNGA